MKEPTTIAEAKRLTLLKIDECMKRPREQRESFWFKTRWFGYDFDQDDHRKYCAFCLIHHISFPCFECYRCTIKKACDWFRNNISCVPHSVSFLKKDLRKLRRMVEEVEG